MISKFNTNLNFQKQLNIYNKKKTNNIFNLFYIDIVANLNTYFYLLSQIEYLKLKIIINSIFNDEIQLNSNNILPWLVGGVQFDKLFKFDYFVLSVIKLLLYYLWDFEGTYKDKLVIDFSSKMQFLKYQLNVKFNALCIELNDFDVSIFNIQHKKNTEFYDKFYLYANLLNIYDKKNKGCLDFAHYNNIRIYKEILLSNLSFINQIKGVEIDWVPTNETAKFVQHVIKFKLNKYIQEFIKEIESDDCIRRSSEDWIMLKLEELDYFIEQQLEPRNNKWK